MDHDLGFSKKNINSPSVGHRTCPTRLDLRTAEWGASGGLLVDGSDGSARWTGTGYG